MKQGLLHVRDTIDSEAARLDILILSLGYEIKRTLHVVGSLLSNLLRMGSVGELQKDGEVSQLVDRNEGAIASGEQYGEYPLRDLLSC